MSRVKPAPQNPRATVKVTLPRWTAKQIQAMSIAVVRFECGACGLHILDVGRSLDPAVEALAGGELMVPAGVSAGVVTTAGGRVKAHLRCRRCGRPDEQASDDRLRRLVDMVWTDARESGLRHAVERVPL